MSKCKKCGKPYEVLGEDDGLCPQCSFDQMVIDDDVEIMTVEEFFRREK